MAEQINIKLLIDAAESAKTVAETKKALRDLRSAALQVEEGSQAFSQIQEAAGSLQDKIGDLQATTKFFANDMRKLEGLTGIAEGIAGGFALAQGAAQLFGSENKNLEASLTKLTSIMAILNGLQSIGNLLQKESAATLLIQNSVRKAAIALTSEQAVAEAAEAVAAGTATIAQRALNAAMNANPVALLVTAILAGVTALTLWTNQSEKAKKEEEKRKKITEEQIKLEKERNEFVAKESGGLNSLLMALKNTNAGSERRLELIKQINADYGLSLKNLQNEDAFMAQVNSTIEEYISLQYNRFKLQKNQEYFDKQQEKKFAAEQKIQKLIKDNTKFYEMYGITTGTAAEKLGQYRKKALDFNADLIKQEEIVADADRALESLGLRKEQLLKVENDLTDGGKKYEKQTKETTKSTKEETKAVYDLTEAYNDLGEGVREANYDINEMALGDAQQSIEKMVALKKLENEKILADLKQANADRLKAFEDAYIEEEKKLEQNQKVAESVLREKAKNDAKYIEAKKVFDKEATDKEKELAEDVTKFQTEEQLRRLNLIKQYTQQILTTDEFNRFITFNKDLLVDINDINNIIAKTSTTLEIIDGKIMKVTQSIDKNISTGAVMSLKRQDEVKAVTEEQLKGTKNLIETTVGESETALDLLASIYQGKLQKINEVTAKINENLKAGGETMTFAIEPVGPDQFGLDVLVNKYEDQAKKLNDTLAVEYSNLLQSETEAYNESLFLAYKNYQDKLEAAGNNAEEIAKVEKEYLDEVEQAQEDHNDRLLLIDVAYGKASTEQMVENFKSKKEKRDTEKQKEIETQKKLNEELLALEAQVQQAILDLFMRSQEARNRAAQNRYDSEIDRINAEEKKYEDSLANRTAAEQADLDIKAGFDEQRKNAEDVLRNEQNAIAKKQFEAQKVNDATTVAIQTAVAVAKTIAQLGGVGALTPPGIALIAAITAQGLVASGLILSKEFIPQFAEGGLVVGPGTGTSDSITAKLSNGESVINAKSTKMFAPVLSAINQAGGGKAIPNFANGGLVTSSMTTTTDNSFDRLEKAIYSLADRPIETYVKQTVVTNAQDTARKIKNRTTFG
jgi:hypothetical protein